MDMTNEQLADTLRKASESIEGNLELMALRFLLIMAAERIENNCEA